MTVARGGFARSLTVAAAVVGAAIVLAVGGAGTFALWSGTAAANGGTVSSATTGLTVNGTASTTVAGLDASKLAPGTSVVSTLTLTNTGTTALTVALSQSVVTGQTKSLATKLTVRLTKVASEAACTSALAGPSGALSGFSTTASTPLPSGASAFYCLELGLASDAPASMQGGTAAFTLTFTGTQVAP